MTSDYLFHGSTRSGLKKIIPNVPHDGGHDPKNKEAAVYATKNVCEAIIFSLIRGFYGAFRVTHSDDNVITACFPRSFGDQLRTNVGSLYILMKSDFPVREPLQHKSFTAVTPIDEIEVCLEDYLDLGGQLKLEEEVSVEEEEE